METTKNYYVGKWYISKVCNAVVIVKVTGISKAGEKYDSDSYIGKKTMIFENGNSLNGDWACYYKAFESMIKGGEIKEFMF